MYVAKPESNTNRGVRLFETKKEANEYLINYTGIYMATERIHGKVFYDWELVGKLFEYNPQKHYEITRELQSD